MSVSSSFFSYLNFTLITVHNIHHRQNVSSNRNQTLTVKCSHSAETVEFCYGFKLLRLAFWFQTLSVTVSHFCMPVYQVNVTPKRTVPFSNYAAASCERGFKVVYIPYGLNSIDT